MALSMETPPLKRGLFIVFVLTLSSNIRFHHRFQELQLDYEDRPLNFTQSNVISSLYNETQKIRKERGKKFNSWFDNTTGKLIPNADENGLILDFAISGFPKCGTTTMEANLGYLAPMPIADVCTPLPNTVWYAYNSWPDKYNSTNKNLNRTKILRGTKCPRFISSESFVTEFSHYLPQTLLLIGIRHPIDFFQSFWNMLADNDFPMPKTKTPYDVMEQCSKRQCNSEGCLSIDGKRTKICFHKTRFHILLAKLGKTMLSNQERNLLAPNDYDGGLKLSNFKIQNPIFIYEINQLKEDYMWNELAQVLQVPDIPHDRYHGDNKNRKKSKHRIDLCSDTYDDFRAAMLPQAYNMSRWFCEYLVPIAKDDTRDDVVIANPDLFCDLVRSYGKDPCNKLTRIDNGTYVSKGQDN